MMTSQRERERDVYKNPLTSTYRLYEKQKLVHARLFLSSLIQIHSTRGGTGVNICPSISLDQEGRPHRHSTGSAIHPKSLTTFSKRDLLTQATPAAGQVARKDPPIETPNTTPPESISNSILVRVQKTLVAAVEAVAVVLAKKIEVVTMVMVGLVIIVATKLAVMMMMVIVVVVMVVAMEVMVFSW